MPTRAEATRPSHTEDAGLPPWSGRTAPDLETIERLAEAALASLPEEFAPATRELLIRVEDLADDETLKSLGIENPLELTGLYDGRALTERSHDDPPDMPSTVWLYRRAILDEWIERGDVALDRLVAHVLVHEIAHHLGWSDDDIAAIDQWWT